MVLTSDDVILKVQGEAAPYATGQTKLYNLTYNTTYSPEACIGICDTQSERLETINTHNKTR